MAENLYWIEGPWSGRLAIGPRPRGGDWLEDEVRAWRRAGVDRVVSLLTASEAHDLDLADEARLCDANGVRFDVFAIEDRGVPSSPSSLRLLVQSIATDLASGESVAVHCRKGIGRAAVVAASVSIAGGLDDDSAVAKVASARGLPVPETPAQRRWIAEFAGTLRPTTVPHRSLR